MHHRALYPSQQVPVTRQFQDQSLDEASAGRAAEPAPVKKLRIDLSWTFWPPPPPTEEGEEPPEEPALEYNLVMYNKDVSGSGWASVRGGLAWECGRARGVQCGKGGRWRRAACCRLRGSALCLLQRMGLHAAW